MLFLNNSKSKHDNKSKLEASNTFESTKRENNSNDTYHNRKNIYQNNKVSYTKSAFSFSVNQVLEESKKSIERNMHEARNQIPSYFQVFMGAHKQSAQTVKEVSENYLENQRQVIDSFQSVLAPYFENIHN